MNNNYILTNTDCEIVKVRDSGEIAIVEVDKINEILRDNKFNLINDELKKQGYSKVALNLSQIDDNEYISIDYGKGSFSYQLPYTINLENTKKQMENIISDDEDKIKTDKITILKDGLIKGHDLESYELALDTFMEIFVNFLFLSFVKLLYFEKTELAFFECGHYRAVQTGILFLDKAVYFCGKLREKLCTGHARSILVIGF